MVQNDQQPIADPRVEREKKPAGVLRFVLRFLIVLTVLAIVFAVFSAVFHRVMVGFMAITAALVDTGLRLLGLEIVRQGRFLATSHITVEVIEECTGIYEAVIFAAAVIAYPARWISRCWGLLGGIAVLYLLNIIRMLFLIAVGNARPEWFDFLHIYFWQATLILMIVGVWLLWLLLIARRDATVFPITH